MPTFQQYEIRVQGWLEPWRFDWFEGLQITNLETGDAVLAGRLPDQAALHSVLTKIRDLNLVLVSVQLIRERGDL